MSKHPDNSQDEINEAEVSSDLEDEKRFAKTLNLDDVKSGQWFVALLQRVVQAYDRNARAEYFQQKYPGLHPDELADILTSVTVRYATIAGAITGAASTVNMIATLSSAGMTAGLLVGVIGAEMLYLARIQMRLILDFSVLYDLQLDPDDPEDMLMIFGYALGVAPTEMVGKGLQVAAGAGTKEIVRKYISKGTLKAIQDSGRRVGLRILQRTIIKYTVPIASAIVGSSYNYVTTKSIGRIAKVHLKNRGKVTDELRHLVSRQNTYTIAFPAAAMYMAQIDGQVSAKEKEFYRALLSRMSFEEHSQAEFQKLIKSEDNLIEVLSTIEDYEIRSSLIEVLVLMAVYDGELVEPERDFLIKAAAQLNVPLDISEVEQRTADYRIVVEKSLLQKTTGIAKEGKSKAMGIAGQTAGSFQEAATTTSNKITNTVGKVFRRKKENEQNTKAAKSTITCMDCGNEGSIEHKYCPNCGASQG